MRAASKRAIRSAFVSPIQCSTITETRPGLSSLRLRAQKRYNSRMNVLPVSYADDPALLVTRDLDTLADYLRHERAALHGLGGLARDGSKGGLDLARRYSDLVDSV